MPRERRTIESALSRKGFRVDQSDHRRYWLFYEGRKQAIATMLSHGSGYRTIDDSLLLRIAKQLKLTKAELLALVDCSMDGDAYIRALLDRGIDLRP